MSSALATAFGFSHGIKYTQLNDKEREVKQGRNYYLTAMTYPGQLTSLSVVAQTLSTTFLKRAAPLPIAILYNIVPILSLPLSIIAASVKHGQYKELRNYITNHGERLTWLLPRKLSERTVKVLNFFAENLGNIAMVAMTISSVALIALGNYFFGGAIIAALIYQKIHRAGYVPRKIGLFVETYIPTLASLLVILTGGPIIAQAFAVCQLASLLPAFNRLVTQKVDSIFRKINPRSIFGHTLEAYEAPLISKENMSALEMNEILKLPHERFEINPAHCSKSILNASDLPDDSNFEDLFTLHQGINFLEKANVLRQKLKTDERMIFHLVGENGSLEEGKRNFNKLLEEKALKEHKSVDQFLVDWNRQEMRRFVDVLIGKIMPEGEEADLNEMLTYAKKILPFLKSTDDPILKEDILLKLSVEAGGYCARGLKRCAHEILNETIIPNLLEKKERQQSDVLKSYEVSIMGRLQNLRHRFVQESYEAIAKYLKIPRVISSDIHGFDIYRKMLSLGFYPISEIERQRLTLEEIVCWGFYSQWRENMLTKYKAELYSEISSLGNTQFVDYIVRKINENPNLTEDQKDRILDKFSSANEGRWTTEETNERFYRLMLVSLGVLRIKN